jgi:O-succinylbenzoic acid--CoA ligase
MTLDWPTRDLLAHRAAATPDRTALVAAETGESWTYRDLDAAVADLVPTLERFAPDYDGTVGVLLDTRVEFVHVAFAAMRRAQTLVPLNVRLTAEELRPQADRADLDVLVCGADTEALAVEVADCPVVTVDDAASDEVAAVEDTRGSAASPVRFDRDETLLVSFTSGTTGEPKGVRLTAGNLVASATASAFRLGVTPDDRWLVCLPTYHVGGFAPIVRSALYGTALVVQESFDPEATARVVAERGVTAVSLVPTMLSRLLDAGWTPPDHLRSVLLGGAPASPGLIDRCAERGVPVHPTYGTTETASQITTARPREAFSHPGTVGQPLVCTDLSVVADGEPVGSGEVGEIVVDGPTVTPGYLDDERTEAAFGDRGFNTGDRGYRDDDGRLRVVGRADDRIVSGGENVDPGEVVDALREHPEVADAAVVGLGDSEWGERVAALVVAEPDADPDPDDLRAFLDGRLASYKQPRTWGFAEALPRTASGTVDRDAVRGLLRDD